MACWLIKCDPDDYGFADLVRDRRTSWDGVANALALKHLAAMRRGDDLLVYETGKVRALVGRARVAAAIRPDRQRGVEISAGAPLPRPVPLSAIKAESLFADFALLRIGRLSVLPVPEPMRVRLLELAEA